MRATAVVVLLLARMAAAQPYLVKDIDTTPPVAYGSFPSSIIVVGSTLYFVATEYEHGSELWKSDGTAEGTSLLADLQFGPPGSSPRALTAFGSALVFIANDEDGPWLWITRGTAATTTRLGPAAKSRSQLVVLRPTALRPYGPTKPYTPSSSPSARSLRT